MDNLLLGLGVPQCPSLVGYHHQLPVIENYLYSLLIVVPLDKSFLRGQVHQLEL